MILSKDRRVFLLLLLFTLPPLRPPQRQMLAELPLRFRAICFPRTRRLCCSIGEISQEFTRMAGKKKKQKVCRRRLHRERLLTFNLSPLDPQSHPASRRRPVNVGHARTRNMRRAGSGGNETRTVCLGVHAHADSSRVSPRSCSISLKAEASGGNSLKPAAASVCRGRDSIRTSAAGAIFTALFVFRGNVCAGCECRRLRAYLPASVSSAAPPPGGDCCLNTAIKCVPPRDSSRRLAYLHVEAAR